MKIALVHDYLNEFGGAERVLLSLSEIYPDAPIYTAYATKNSAAYEHFKNKKIIQSWFSKIPYSNKLISPLRFLVPFIWSSFDFSKYDIVITSSSWAVTKGVVKRNPTSPGLRGTKEICYLHTPPRYLYGYDTSRNWQQKWFSGLVKLYAIVVNHFMRMYDWNAAQRVDYFISNSENVGKRIEKFYKRTDYTVIHPPIDIKKFSNPRIKPAKGDYYLAGGRFTAAKNFDLIIKTFNKNGKKLKIYGTGVLEDELKAIAKDNIKFVGRVSDEELVALYKGAKAFILAQKDEDFGITVVEAAAAGCPAIAYKAEGYLETLVENKTGIFFVEQSIESLEKAINKFEKTKIDPRDCRKQAEKFSKERFEREIKEFIKKVW